MWIFVVVFLILFPCHSKEECSLSISISQNGNVDVTFGQRFNLTCHFTCLTATHRVQLLINKQMFTEVSLSSDCPASKHNIVLFLLIPAVHHNNSGIYKCQSDPPDVISSVKVNVVYPDKHKHKTSILKHKHNVTETDPAELTSEVKSTCNAPFSWNAPLWYLLGKTAFFLVCSLSMVLKKTC